MKFIGLVICETAIIDARTNNISFINAIEDINLIGVPGIIPKVTAVARFEKEPGDTEDSVPFNLKITLDGKEMMRHPVIADFKGRARARAIIEIGGIQLSGPGKLKFEIIRDDRTLAESAINVNLKAPPQVKVDPS